MKNHYYVKIAVLALAVGVTLTACKSTQTVSATDSKAMEKTGAQGFKELKDLPCQGTDSNAEYIIVNGEGKSKDRVMAKDKAYLNALENLASKLDAVASKETQRVAVSTEADEEDFHSKTINMGKQIANANVSGYRTACEKFVVYDNGTFGCFITVEYGKQKIVKQLFDGMSKEKMMRADYDFDKYMKQFNEDLKEYEQSKK